MVSSLNILPCFQVFIFCHVFKLFNTSGCEQALQEHPGYQRLLNKLVFTPLIVSGSFWQLPCVCVCVSSSSMSYKRNRELDIGRMVLKPMAGIIPKDRSGISPFLGWSPCLILWLVPTMVRRYGRLSWLRHSMV